MSKRTTASFCKIKGVQMYDTRWKKEEEEIN